jgi:hypothetical protein
LDSRQSVSVRSNHLNKTNKKFHPYRLIGVMKDVGYEALSIVLVYGSATLVTTFNSSFTAYGGSR